MKVKNIFIALSLAVAANAAAQTAADSPMTRAVMQVYDKMIEADPSDYETLFARATEYYNQDEYLRALD
ncbi:MAG: hypothetical protein K2I18_04015, partial [Paramuribaculum sp.]|nr:hypothetical protein [Paramuribaculum sp.]